MAAGQDNIIAWPENGLHNTSKAAAAIVVVVVAVVVAQIRTGYKAFFTAHSPAISYKSNTPSHRVARTATNYTALCRPFLYAQAHLQGFTYCTQYLTAQRFGVLALPSSGW